MEIYVRVKVDPVAVGTKWPDKDKFKMIHRHSMEALLPLKAFVQKEWPDLVYSPSNLYPSLVIYPTDKSQVNDIVSKLKALDYVELVENS